MVTACKNYIMTDVSKVWELSSEEALQRIGDSLRLNQEYQNCFRKTKQKLQVLIKTVQVQPRGIMPRFSPEA